VNFSDHEKGFLGCLIDVSEEEALKELLDRLPAGLFQITNNGEFIQANPVLAKLLGFNESSQVLGRNLVDFLVDSGEFDKLQSELQESAVAKRERLELRRGGEVFLSNFSAATLPASVTLSGASSILGTLQDVSDRELLRELLETAPVGVYKVLYHEGQHRIVECNTTFAAMFDFNSVEEVKGRDIRALHRNSVAYERFLEALRKEDITGRALLNYRIHATLLSGRSVTFSINARLLHDKRTHEERGRIGILSDVTGLEQEDRATRLIKRDIGNFLHEYDKLLASFSTRLPSVRSALVLAYEKRSHGHDDLTFLLEKLVLRLLQGVEQELLPLNEVAGRNDAIPAASWERLRNLVVTSRRRIQQQQFADFKVALYHRVANNLGVILEEVLQSQRFQRDKIKELLRTAVQASAIGSILAIDRMSEGVGGMIQGSRSLRDYLTSGSRTPEAPKIIPLEDLVEQALTQVSDYADLRHVTFKAPSLPKNLKVRVVEREMLRALSNIFHNAIKYSWAHEADSPSWVTLRASRDGGSLVLEVENYGVPLTAEEVRSGRLFQLGFRGSLALDRGRAGTGIGLADAKAVITDARGTIALASRPATPGSPPDDYTRPFLTTVRIELPLV
jgi:PAS domain S-box-containing protein